MRKTTAFNPDTVVSTRFLNMPQSAQVLYFILGIYADNDGFVSEPDRIMKRIGSSWEDLKELTNEHYIVTSNAVPVFMCIWISDWRHRNVESRGGWGMTYKDVYLMDNLTIESKLYMVCYVVMQAQEQQHIRGLNSYAINYI